MHDIERYTLMIEANDKPLALIEALQEMPTFALIFPTENGVRVHIERVRDLTDEEQAEQDRVKAQRVRNEEIRAEIAARHQIAWLHSQPHVQHMRQVSKALRTEEIFNEIQALRKARVGVQAELDACRDQAATQDFLEEIRDIDFRLAALKIQLNSVY